MRKVLVSLALAAVFLAGCAGAPQYHYAFDPAFRFTPPKTYAWYDDPDFKMPGGGAVVARQQFHRIRNRSIRLLHAQPRAGCGFGCLRDNPACGAGFSVCRRLLGVGE